VKGFLGTNANFWADLNLTLHILMALTLLVGAWFARRKDFDTHQKIQTSVVLLNIVLIAGIMAVSYAQQVVPGLPQNLVKARNSVATVHAILGILGELLGLWVVLRMSRSTRRFIPPSMRFKNVKRMMRLTLATWWSITLIGIATYFLWYAQPGQTAPVAGTPQPLAAGGTVTVPMQNFAYQPQDLVIPVGTTVTWVNEDSAPHTVTSDEGLWDSKLLDQGQSFSFKFDKPGKYLYYCTFHGNPGGAGMVGTVTVVPAEQIAAVPTSVTPPTTTPPPTPEPPPAKPLGPQTVGVLAFQDHLAFSDAVLLNLNGVAPPPAGKVYVGWLTSNAAPAQSLGAIPVGAGVQVSFMYVSPTRTNLLVTYDGFQITLEPVVSAGAAPSGPSVYEGRLPPQALAHLRTLIASAPDAPAQKSYAVGIRADAEELLRQAQFARDAIQTGDLTSVKRHAEVIVNVIEGRDGRDYGDLDKDGKILDSSDGFGLLQGGARPGYLRAADQAAKEAAAAPDTTEAIKIHSGHAQVCVANLLSWVEEARDKALAIIRASDVATAQPLVQELLALSQTILRGVDIDGNGQVDPVPGEGGALTLYQHAQYAAAIGVAASGSVPGATPGATTAATTAGPLTVTVKPSDKSDGYFFFSFEPTVITVTLGTQVTWVNMGQAPHTTTSDTNVWGSQVLNKGDSFTFTFDQEGVFPYYCKLHGQAGGKGMAGTVVVQKP